ncbi:integrase, catalytic region, zinc finger, CCHC-type containing protein [Tanacetum coccineum]|uniref:Integrase, catalytic region, zinc finger, CCHC-type containing protein n=1 Tax=Tanacetum coccineum TaxID=301880 RepID=A0ABQ5H2F3_9ASTR
MAILSAVAASRFPLTNNQLRTSSNPRNQATIQDGKVTMQQVQGRQGQSYTSTGYKGNATSSGGNNAGGQARVVKCYNCQGEGYMARQCTQPKRPRNAAWFKEKAMLAEAQESAAQTTIPNNAAFQTEDLDAYDSNCDDVSTSQAVLMANLSNYGSDVILEVPHSEPYHNDMDNQSVHAMQEMQQAAVQDTNFCAQQDSMILSVIEQMSEQMINHVNNCSRKNSADKPMIYEWSVISIQTICNLVIDDDETFILEEAPRELPKVSLVNISLKKLKYHLGNFDTAVKKRITPDAITEGEWGFKHTKAVFLNEIIPFLKTLKDIFNVFDKDLLNEVTKVQTAFNQMEAAVHQCSVDKQCFEIHKKELFLENDQLLHQIMPQDVMTCVINSTAIFGDSMNLEMKKSKSFNKCLDLEAELVKRKNMVE